MPGLSATQQCICAPARLGPTAFHQSNSCTPASAPAFSMPSMWHTRSGRSTQTSWGTRVRNGRGQLATGHACSGGSARLVGCMHAKPGPANWGHNRLLPTCCTDPLVETASLASIPLPALTFRHSLHDCVAQRLLSDAQLETIVRREGSCSWLGVGWSLLNMLPHVRLPRGWHAERAWACCLTGTCCRSMLHCPPRFCCPPLPIPPGSVPCPLQIYANMKFAGPRLADDKRAGFFLGDGGWTGGASCCHNSSAGTAAASARPRSCH